MIEALAQVPIAVIGAGYHHSMALSTKSQLYCWGSGWSGQLGTGTNTDANLPTLVDVPNKQDKSGKLVRLAAGYHHSMALTDSGRIYSWGTGDVGQLGHGPQKKRCSVPSMIASTSNQRFIAISASENHSVALTDDGHVYTWGHNRWKQLGHTFTASDKTHIPQPVSTTVLFTRIAAGSAHTIAVSKDHQLYYWGRMVLSSECFESPKLLEATANITFSDVASRVNHCLMLTKTGDLWSFGYNEFGQCGSGHVNPLFQPILSPVLNGLKFSQVVAGGNHSLALAQHESILAGAAKQSLGLLLSSKDSTGSLTSSPSREYRDSVNSLSARDSTGSLTSSHEKNLIRLDLSNSGLLNSSSGSSISISAPAPSTPMGSNSQSGNGVGTVESPGQTRRSLGYSNGSNGSISNGANGSNGMVTVNTSGMGLGGLNSPTSPTTSPRRTRFAISKPASSSASANIMEQLAYLTRKEQELRAEREQLRAQQRALDEAVADWTRRDDEIAAERTRVLKEAGLV
jgi:alpha-tubulin suppressor-like RCC1 family protein